MTSTLPVWIDDPVNAAILAVSEDRLAGFQLDPFGQIAERAGVPVGTVLERIVAMLDAGTIRRVRQTLMATNLAAGALVAWQVPQRASDRGVRVSVARRSVFGPRRDPHDRRRDAGFELPLVDDAQGSAGLFASRSTRGMLAGRIGAERVPVDAGQVLFALGRRSRAPYAASHRARAPTTAAKPTQHRDRRTQRAANGAC